MCSRSPGNLNNKGDGPCEQDSMGVSTRKCSRSRDEFAAELSYVKEWLSTFGHVWDTDRTVKGGGKETK